MTHFDLAAVFIGLVAAIGWLNSRWLRLPPSVAMLAVGLLGSILLIGLRRLPAVSEAADFVLREIGRVNFPGTVVGYMLAFLLFAGGMQADLGEIARRRVAILSLATIGVFVSTAIVGVGVWLAARALDAPIDLGWALVFGALISPTDPVAVLSTVRPGALSPPVLATLQVGIVVFLEVLAFATGGHAVRPLSLALGVLVEAGGGVLLGVVAGAVVGRAMRAIDDYAVEVTLTVALAAGVYAGGQALHVSGALAAVAAGLMTGGENIQSAMSDLTRRYVQGFWTLVDELLTALLFLLLGLQTAVLRFDPRDIAISAAAVGLVLLARLAVVLPWGAYYRLRHEARGAGLLLAWGGLRGALSLALALQTPDSPARPAVLAATYTVVVFAVLVQGLSFPALVAALSRPLAGGGERS
jgi:CPA1 family monovalent cation:H+ antiporter